MQHSEIIFLKRHFGHIKQFNIDSSSESVYTKIYIQHVHRERAHREIQHCTIKLPNKIQTFPTIETKYFRDKHFLDMLLKNMSPATK